MTCSGKKGCFLSNSIRDYAIIPSKAKKYIADNSKQIHELLEQNLVAAGVKKDTATMASLIMTFSAGLSLKLNIMKPDELLDEVDKFLNLFKAMKS